MKKLFLLPVFFVAALSVANAQTVTTAGAPSTSVMQRENGPIMTFEQLDHNFGTIKQGEVVTHEFKFTNTGKEPLIINNAAGSCGCTVPEWPKEPIRPGGTGVIKVTFNSAGKANVQDKQVTITYDTDKTVVLHMKGTVEVPAATPAPSTGGTSVAAPTGGTTTTTTAPASKGGTTTTTTPATTKGGTTTTTPAATPAPKSGTPKAVTTVSATPAPASKPAETKKGGE
jgi:hypothetical protein